MPKKTGHKIEGRPLTNYDLNEIRRHLAQIEKVDAISDQARDVVETEFPELAHKLPPRSRSSYQNKDAMWGGRSAQGERLAGSTSFYARR